MGKKSEPLVLSMAEVLGQKSENLLCDIAAKLHLGIDCRRLDQQTLVREMAARLTDGEARTGFVSCSRWIMPTIMSIDDVIFGFIDEIVEKGSVALANRADQDIIDYFRGTWFVGLRENARSVTATLPIEYLEDIRRDRTDYDEARRNGDWIEDCAAAATCLYGAVTFEEIAELCRRYCDDGADSDLVSGILKARQCDRECGFFTTNEYVLHNEFNTKNVDAEVRHFLAERSGKPRWFPATSAELLSYAGDCGYELGPQAAQLKEWLSRHGDKKADDTLWTIYFNVQQECRMQDNMDAVEDAGVRLKNDTDAMEVVQLIAQYQNKLHLRVNNGYTPDELGPLMAKMHSPARNEMPKVGRNDLCPCGSGKKYKKCCGR